MNRKRHIGFCLVPILIFVFLFTPLNLISQDSFDLRLNLAEGNTYYQKVISEQKISQKVLGMDQEFAQTVSLGCLFYVEQVDHNRISRVRVTINDLKISINGLTGLIEYDSQQPSGASSPVLKSFSGLTGKSFIILIASSARITKVYGLERIFRDNAKEQEMSETSLMNILDSSVSAGLNDDSFAEMLEDMFALFPGRPVRRGDSWKRTKELSFPAGSISEQTFTLRRIRNGLAEIDVYEKLVPGAGRGSRVTEGVFLDASGIKKGKIMVRLSDGWLTGGVLDQDMKGSMGLSGLGQDISIPVIIKQTIRIVSGR